VRATPRTSRSCGTSPSRSSTWARGWPYRPRNGDSSVSAGRNAWNDAAGRTRYLPVAGYPSLRLEKRIAIGASCVDTGASAANPNPRRYNEILNPRVWRFGVRFEF